MFRWLLCFCVVELTQFFEYHSDQNLEYFKTIQWWNLGSSGIAYYQKQPIYTFSYQVLGTSVCFSKGNFSSIATSHRLFHNSSCNLWFLKKGLIYWMKCIFFIQITIHASFLHLMRPHQHGIVSIVRHMFLQFKTLLYILAILVCLGDFCYTPIRFHKSQWLYGEMLMKTAHKFPFSNIANLHPLLEKCGLCGRSSRLLSVTHFKPWSHYDFVGRISPLYLPNI